jgi:starvation-inducible DNA-binding protein
MAGRTLPVLPATGPAVRVQPPNRRSLVRGQPDRPNAPPLADEVSAEIGKQLQLTLVELIALSLAGKQLQWSCYGCEFVGVHGHLDRLVAEWRALEDDVAERAAAIGIALDGTAAAVIELDDHRPLEPGFTEIAFAIERLYSHLWDVALRVRQRGEILGALDAVSQHVLIEIQRKLERQLWMLRSQLAD